ncbi:uncharacterized protein LOC121376944 [Gigantopelta aegis]|uniref:uncharacterized protein LOC121376944 n=1 Tax=Gigantopelta aegis TaxID=1735272 RepID=UPI001B88C42C|nr:uncharacterized protein LOC121376944 [Gigantopelta aegis]
MASAEGTRKSYGKRIKTWVTTCGGVLSILSFICFFISFCTPNWIEQYDKYKTRKFQRMGLWEACFHGWNYYKDYLGKTYYGCWWVFSFEYRPIWTFLNPPWLLGIQVVMSLTFLLTIATLFFALMFICKACPAKQHTRNCAILNMIIAMATTICIIVFGLKTKVDRQWLPHPDSNFLSWSFGFAVLSAFFATFAAMCFTSETIRLIAEEKKPKPTVARQPF